MRQAPAEAKTLNDSGHRNRPGYTLTSGSGCLTNGVHFSHLIDVCPGARENNNREGAFP